MNVIIITGNISNVGELRYTNSGKAVCDFTVANNQGFGDKKRTEFYKVTLWEKKAEGLHPHLTKGDKIVVRGEHSLDVREYEGKTYTDNLISWPDVDLCGGKKEYGSQAPQQQQSQQQPLGQAQKDNFDDEDLPF